MTPSRMRPSGSRCSPAGGRHSGGHALQDIGGGVDPRLRQGFLEDAGVGASVDLEVIEAGESELRGEGFGDGGAAGPAAHEEGAVDVEEEEAHLGQCSPRSRHGQVAGRRVVWQSWGMTAVPELRTVVERAAGRRHMLEGLIESVPDEYWERQASGDDWTALDHLRHVATVDGMLVELLTAAQESDEELWAGDTSDEAELEARRVALMDGVREQTVEALVETMGETREAALEAALELPAAALDRDVRVAGAPQPLPLRTYLAIWAEHDSEHEAAIRRAIETSPTRPRSRLRLDGRAGAAEPEGDARDDERSAYQDADGRRLAEDGDGVEGGEERFTQDDQADGDDAQVSEA